MELQSFLLVKTTQSKSLEFRDVPLDDVRTAYPNVVEWWLVIAHTKLEAKALAVTYPYTQTKHKRVVEYGWRRHEG